MPLRVSIHPGMLFCIILFLMGCSPSLTGHAVSGDLVLGAGFEGDFNGAVLVRGTLTKVAAADIMVDVKDWASGATLASVACPQAAFCEVTYQEPPGISGQRIYRVRGEITSGPDAGRSVEEVISVPPNQAPITNPVTGEVQPEEQGPPPEQQEIPLPPPVEELPAPILPVCGNNLLETGEECEILSSCLDNNCIQANCEASQKCLDCTCVADSIIQVQPEQELPPEPLVEEPKSISVDEQLALRAVRGCKPVACAFPGMLTGCLERASDELYPSYEMVTIDDETYVRQRCPGTIDTQSPRNTFVEKVGGTFEDSVKYLLIISP